ncbi:MAG: bifunctional phosphoribosylaminoimidazolecarboxamide formyltransferase/IMP cyclohydrolase [Pseudobdellovibrio sp.]
MRALVSTSDKTGLIEFLRPLLSQGLELVSTGGTYEYLKKNDFPVEEVSQITKFPEVLDGRVKTLHPFVHMGLLADKFNPEHVEQLKQHQVKAFDMVIGNLYPFEKTALNPGSSFEDLIENIDIGGPSFLRASAKNYRSVIVIASPEDYVWVQQKIMDNSLTDNDRKKLALKVFSLTAYYDSLIVNKLAEDVSELEYLNIPLKKKQNLRYGENSHQKATWYSNPLEKHSLADAQIHQGKELSYNNLLDLDAAVNLAQTFEKPACVAVKHNNPCGVAIAENISSAAQKAIQADPKSIFGGIVAFNKKVDLITAEQFQDIFLECMIAPSFSEEALKFLSSKKNLRVLTLSSLSFSSVQKLNYKSIAGGALSQDADSFSTSNWSYLSAKPNEKIMESMIFGEKVAAALKSNAIAIVYRGQSIGLGMGQVNRVDAVKHAIERMKEFAVTNTLNMSEVILVSDAFFPFADSIEIIAQNKIGWVLQPGGSVQDQNVISAAQQKNINMVLTHRRHFKH